MDNSNDQHVPQNNNTALVKANSTSLTTLADLHSQAADYIKQAKSANTWRAYKADWADFDQWCASHSLPSLPATPAAVALYLTDRASTLKPASLQRRIASIAQHHIGNHQPDPTKSAEVKETWRGIRRAKGVSQNQKTPVLIDQLKQILFQLPDTTKGKRDKALLLIGLCCGLRRSELVALNVEDIKYVREGMIITLRKSKTDQESAGREIGLPYAHNPFLCPIGSIKEWLDISNISKGAIFRPINRHGQILATRLTDQSVALFVKQYVGALGLDGDNFAGHSLRAGLITSLAMAGLSETAIMRQSGHKSSTVLRKYIRHSELFQDNAIDKLKL